MDKKDLMLIKELMDELSDKMELGEDDFSERLGRPKKGVEVIRVEGEPDLEQEEESMGQDLDNDMEMGEDPEHAAAVLGDEMMSPEEKLKQRLMKLRG